MDRHSSLDWMAIEFETVRGVTMKQMRQSKTSCSAALRWVKELQGNDQMSGRVVAYSGIEA